MFSFDKKLISKVLILAMLFTNSGVSVFADSISNMGKNNSVSEEQAEEDKLKEKDDDKKDEERQEEENKEEIKKDENENNDKEEAIEEATKSDVEENEKQVEDTKEESEEDTKEEENENKEKDNEKNEEKEATESEIEKNKDEEKENTEEKISTKSEIEKEDLFEQIKNIIASSSEVATKSTANNIKEATKSNLYGSYPSKLDYRNLNGNNYVTSIKHQYESNICEVFAMVSGAETYMLYHYGDYITNMIGIAEELNFSELNLLYDTSNGIISPIVGRQKSIAGRGEYYRQGSSSATKNAFYWSKVGGVLEKYAPFAVWRSTQNLYLPYNDGSKSLLTLMNCSKYTVGNDAGIERIKKALNDGEAVSLGEPSNDTEIIVSTDENGKEIVGYKYFETKSSSSGHEMNIIAYDDDMPEGWTGANSKGGVYVKDSSYSYENQVFSYKQLKDWHFEVEIYDYEPKKYNFDNNYFYSTEMGDIVNPDYTVDGYVFTLDGTKVLKGEETVYGFGINGKALDIEVFELDPSVDIESDTMTFDIYDLDPMFYETYEKSTTIEDYEHSTFKVNSELKLDNQHKYAFKIAPVTEKGYTRADSKVYKLGGEGGVAVGNIPDFSILTNETHTVHFDANGGKFSGNLDYKEKTLKNNSLIGIAEPTYEGMTFKGWSNKKDGLMPGGLEDKYHSCYGDIYYAIWEADNGVTEHTVSKDVIDNILSTFGMNKMELQKITFQIAGSLPQNVISSVKIDDGGFVAYKVNDEVKIGDSLYPTENTILIYAPSGSSINLVPKELFSGCMDIKEIAGLNNCSVTGQTDFSNMFNECTQLKEPLDLSSFDTSSATNMSAMFKNCHCLEKIFVSDKFDVSGVTNSSEMFSTSYSVVGPTKNAGSLDLTEQDKTYAHIGELFWDAYPKIEFDDTAVFAYGYEPTENIRYFNEEYILPLGDNASDASKELIRWKDAEDNTYVTIPKGYYKDIKLIPEYNNDPYQGMADFILIPVRTKFGAASPLKIKKGTYFNNLKQLEACVDGYDKSHYKITAALLHTTFNTTIFQTSEEPLSVDYLEDIAWIEPIWQIEYDNEHLLNNATFRPLTTGSTYRSKNKIYDLNAFLAYHHVIANNNGAKINLIFATKDASAYGESNLTHEGKEYTYRTSPDDKGFKIYTRADDDLIEVLFVVPTGHVFKIQKTAYYHKFNSQYSYVFYHFNEFSRAEVRERITAIKGLENVIIANTNELNGDYSNLTRNELVLEGKASDKTIRGLFEGCSNIESLNLSSFDFTEIEDLSSLFKGCTKLKTITLSADQMNKWKDISSFKETFSGCSALQEINLYNFSSDKVTDATNMFYGCTELTTIKVNKHFDLSNVEKGNNIFYNCSKIKGGENSSFVSSDKTFAKIDKGSAGAGYFTDADKKGSVAHITFNINEGEWINEPSEYVQSGVTSITLPTEADIKKEGYTFKGWFDNAGCTGISITTLTITSSKTEYPIWAKWEIKAPVINYYILPYGWYNETITGKSPTVITKIKFEKNPTAAPTVFDNEWEIIGSNGLKAYINGTEVIIYAPEDKTIYAPEDSDHLFSSRSTYDDITKEYQADFNNFFARCESIENLNYLDTSKVENMCAMFQGVGMYNVYGDSTMGNGYPSNIYNVTANPKKVNIDVTSFNTTNVTNMNCMFELSAIENIDVSNFDTSKVTSMRAMFAQAGLIKNIDISSFDMTKVTNANSMFTLCLSIEEIDMTGLTFNDADDYQYMFNNCPKLETIYASNTFTINSSASTNGMFDSCPNLQGENGTKTDGNPTDATYARLDTATTPGYFSSKATRPYKLSYGWYDDVAAGVEKKDVTKISISKYPIAAPTSQDQEWTIVGSGGLKGYIKGTEVTIYAPENKTIYAAEDSGYLFSGKADDPDTIDFDKTFSSCESITGLNYLDTSRVTKMNKMFAAMGMYNMLDSATFDLIANPKTITIDVSGFNTSNVTTMMNMFDMAAIGTINMANFDVSKVTNTQGMFGMCALLENVNLSNWNTTSITNPVAMFTGCYLLKEIKLEGWTLENATDISYLFEGCRSLTRVELASLNTAKVTNMEGMFSGCSELMTIMVTNSFVTTSVTESDNMFDGCNKLKGGRGTTIAGNPVNATYARIDMDGTPGYFTENGKELVGISIVKEPDQVKYKEGESFKPEGLKIETEYSDKSKEEVEYNETTKSGFSFNPSTSYQLKEENDKVEIKYAGKVATQSITVVSLKRIRVSKEPSKVVYNTGESFDPRGLEIELIYSDEVTKATMSYVGNEGEISYSKTDTFKEADGAKQEIKISYRGYESSIEVTVKFLKGISIVASPSKIRYLKGEKFDPTGLKIGLLDSGGGSEELLYTVANKNNFKFNNQQELILDTLSLNYLIKVEYLGMTANLYVVVAELDYITIERDATKLDYIAGQTFKPEGLEILKVYTDGKTEKVTYNNSSKTKFEFEPNLTTALAATNDKVKIKYDGKEVEQNIAVLEVLEFKMKATPTNLSYTSGQKLNIAGLVMEATYKDKSNATNAREITYNTANSSDFTFVPSLSTALTAANKTVTITYGGKSITYNITVANNTPSYNPSNNSESRSDDSGSSSRGSSISINSMNQNQYTTQVTVQTNVTVNKSQFGTLAKMNMTPINNIKTNNSGNVMTFTTEKGEKLKGLQKVLVNNKEGYYYFNNDSTLYCGFMKDENNNVHYFGIDGKMLTNTSIRVGQKKYDINTNGEIIQNSFTKEEKQQIYSNCALKLYSGETVRDTKTGEWSTYIINPLTGQKEKAKGMVQLVQEDGINTYYFDINGILRTGYIYVNGKIRLFNQYNGRLME